MTTLAAPHGWLIVNKPSGPSSTQMGNQLRRLLGASRLGHAGTLDPMAQGVLPMALGEATKTVYLFEDVDKSYSFRVVWGESRDTLDALGKVTATGGHRPSAAAIAAVLPQFIGNIMQVPPAYSAIKINGQRAYDLARRGEDVSIPARQVTLSTLHHINSDDIGDTFSISCSKGTYVRTLAADMAHALGTLAYVDVLCRTRVGDWHLADAICPRNLPPVLYSALIPIERALTGILAVSLCKEDAQNVRRYGRSVRVQAQDAALAVALYQTTPVALGRIEADDLGARFCPQRVFVLPDAAYES